ASSGTAADLIHGTQAKTPPRPDPSQAHTFSAKEFLALADVLRDSESKVCSIPVSLKALRLITESLEASKHTAPSMQNLGKSTRKKSGPSFSVGHLAVPSPLCDKTPRYREQRTP